MNYYNLLKRTQGNKNEIEQKLNFAMKHGNLDKEQGLYLLDHPEKAEEYLYKGEGE